jgi:hypothetical protein
MPYKHVAAHAVELDSRNVHLCSNSNITTKNQHIRPVHLISEPGKGVATQNKEANETIDSSLESRKLRKQQHIHLELEDLTKLREFYQQKSSILSKVMQ